MIKVDSAIAFLKKNKKPETFDKIFKSIKSELADLYDGNDAALKAELWNAFIGSIEIVRVSEDTFDLANNYSKPELARIEKLNQGVEDVTKGEE